MDDVVCDAGYSLAENPSPVFAKARREMFAKLTGA